MVSEIRDMKFS